MRLALFATLALLLAAAACHKAPPPANSLDAIDNDLVDGAIADEVTADKALAAAIHVDPAEARKVAARVAERPLHSEPAMPAVIEDGEGSPVGGGTGCLAGLGYGDGWARKLPADLPMHPAATLAEAAGHDGPCQARIASFAVAGDRGQLLGWYAAKARAAGYSVGRADSDGDWVLVGEKGASAYHIDFGPARGGETPVDYIWTSGD